MIPEIEKAIHSFALLPDGWDLFGVHFADHVLQSARLLSRRACRLGLGEQVIHAEHDGSLTLVIAPTRDSEFQVGILPDGTFELVVEDCAEAGIPSIDRDGLSYESVMQHMRWVCAILRNKPEVCESNSRNMWF